MCQSVSQYFLSRGYWIVVYILLEIKLYVLITNLKLWMGIDCSMLSKHRSVGYLIICIFQIVKKFPPLQIDFKLPKTNYLSLHSRIKKVKMFLLSVNTNLFLMSEMFFHSVLFGWKIKHDVFLPMCINDLCLLKKITSIANIDVLIKSQFYICELTVKIG